MLSDEGYFLKQQIIKSYPESMFAYILRNDVVEIFACKTFRELDSLITLHGVGTGMKKKLLNVTRNQVADILPICNFSSVKSYLAYGMMM